MNRVFLLSPANCNGVRARWLLDKRAGSALAQQLRSDSGAPIGDALKFLSALYFGANWPMRLPRQTARDSVGVAIITPTAG